MPYELHVVIINKSVPLDSAKKMAQNIIKDKNRTFMRETTESYRFRNLAKTKFVESTFRTKVVNPDISLVFGKLK
jgi:hypothetical protein